MSQGAASFREKAGTYPVDPDLLFLHYTDFRVKRKFHIFLEGELTFETFLNHKSFTYGLALAGPEPNWSHQVG